MNKSLSISALATTFAILLGASQANAASDTWVGSTDTNWATPANWGTTAPVSGDSLTFNAAGSKGAVLTNTLTSSAFNVAGITFGAAAPAYTMTGATFNLTSGINNGSTSLQTFSNTGGLSGNTNLTFTLGGGITITNGLTNVSGGGTTLTANGAGSTLTLGGYNINTGTNRIGGVINGTGNVNITGNITSGDSVDNLTYSGSGTLTIGGGYAFNSNGSALNVSSGTILLTSAQQGAPVVVSGTGSFNETAAGSILNVGGAYGGFSMSGTGTTTLAGSNTYQNATTVSGGTFSLSGAGTLSGGTAITVSGGAFNESGGAVISSTSAITTTGGVTTLSGVNTYTGATNVNGGTLTLDFSGATTPTTAINIIKSGNTVNLGGGALVVKGGGSGATNTQTFGATALTANTASTITGNVNGGTALNLALGGITRNAQSTVDLTLPAAGTFSTTSTTFASNSVLVSAAANGIAFATVGGTTWATNTTGTIGALGTYQTNYAAPASNIDVGAADAPTTAFTVNTLRFNVANASLTAPSGTNTISTGGILVTSVGTGSSITGGKIQSGGGKELVIIDNGSLTVGSVIQDNATASALTLSGTGTTTLSAANTFTGQTAVLGGTLKLANQLALQNSILQLNTGGSLVFDQSESGNAFTIGGLNSSVNIALLNNATTPAPIALTLGNSGTLTPTYSGVFSGAGASLLKTGTDTQALAGASTYTGTTTVSGGVLQFNGGGSILNSSAVTVGAGAQVAFATNESESNVLTGGISGAGGIGLNINNPSNVLLLNEANTYTGATTYITRGVTTPSVAPVYSGGVLVSSAFGVNSALTFTGTGGETVILNGISQQLGSLVGGIAGNGVVLDGANLTIGGDNTNAMFGGQITGGLIPGGATGTHYNGLGSSANVTGNLIKIGTGTQSFTNPNFYVGSTTIKGGTLSINSIANGGVATTLTSTAATGTTTLNVASTAGVAVGQNIVGSGGIQSQTVSALTANTVTLSTATTDQAVNSGTSVYFGTGNGLGISTNAASNLVLDGGTLQYTGAAASTDRLFTVGSTVAGATGTLDASGTGALTFSNTGSVAYGTTGQTRTLGLTGTNTGTNTLAALIADNGSGAVSVLKSGAGSWTLTNANSYTGGTTVNGGTLTSAVAGGFGAGNLTVAPTGILAANSTTLNSTGSIASTALVTVNNNGAATGTVNFNDAMPAIGGLSGNGKAVLNNATGTTLTVGANNSSSTFGGVISEGTAGMGSLVKAGTGTFTISGAGTYTGGTTVNGGTLGVSSGATLSGALNVSNGGTLTGQGTVGATTVSGGGAINLTDNTIGTLHTGSITIGAAGTPSALTFEVNTVSAITSTDSIADAGNLTFSGANGTTITIGNVTGNSTLTNGTYSLITYTGTLTGFSNLTLSTTSLDGKVLSLVNSAGVIQLNIASAITATGTSYTLTTTAGSTLLHAGATTGLTTTITNTGTGTADTLNYTGLTASSSSGNGIAPGAQSGGPLANNGGSASNSQTYTATNSGTDTISANGSGTNATLGTAATPTSATGTTITVYSGQGVYTNATTTGSWGTVPTATPANWTAGGGVPGVTPGFTGVDTATFGAVSGGTPTATVNLDGANPDLNAINFTTASRSYTVAQGTGGAITLSGIAPSINVTAGSHVISAPITLGSATSLATASGTQLEISGVVSGGNSLTKTGAGTATLSNATGNTYSGGTSDTAGRTLVTNTSGSATGTGAVSVTGSTTVLGGSGKISGAITLSSGGDLYSGATGNNVSGGPGTGAVNGTAGGMVLTSALNVNGGALTFALANTATSSYASPALSTSYITANGGVSFTGTGNTINLVDLTNGGLSLRMQQPYLLISAGSDSMFHGLVTVDSSGVVSIDGDGYVLGVSTGSGFAYTTITINQFGSDGVTPLSAGNSYNAPVLYLSGGNLEVVPEPSTWALMIGGLALLIIINRRKSNN